MKEGDVGEGMQRGEDFYRRLFEKAGDAILVHDRGGRILEANPQAGTLLGRRPDRIKGRRLSALCPEDERDALGFALQLLSGKGVVRFETRFSKSGEEPVPVDVSASWVDREQGVVQAVLRDISERVRSEKLLRAYSTALESRVAAQTQDLEAAREELWHKQKLALLGQLSAGVAHELRNPLGAVKAASYYLNMVLKEPSEEVKESLDILQQEVNVSERIIRRLFDYADPRAPRTRILDLRELIGDVMPVSKVPGLRVVHDFPERPLTVKADREQLSKVFQHILQNSRQAMPEGGTMTVRGEPQRDWVSVTLADTGEGIPSENLAKVFEPFYTTRAKGIGLGLALARTFVEMHGGRVILESREGEGTSVTVLLPQVEAASPWRPSQSVRR